MRQQLKRQRQIIQAQYALSVVGFFLLSHEEAIRALVPARWGAGLAMVVAVLRALQVTLPPKN